MYAFCFIQQRKASTILFCEVGEDVCFVPSLFTHHGFFAFISLADSMMLSVLGLLFVFV